MSRETQKKKRRAREVKREREETILKNVDRRIAIALLYIFQHTFHSPWSNFILVQTKTKQEKKGKKDALKRNIRSFASEDLKLLYLKGSEIPNVWSKMKMKNENG